MPQKLAKIEILQYLTISWKHFSRSCHKFQRQIIFFFGILLLKLLKSLFEGKSAMNQFGQFHAIFVFLQFSVPMIILSVQQGKFWLIRIII